MKTFTGWQYLLIDVANQWGLDKLRFEDRIQWAEANLDNLEALGEQRAQWKEYPLYRKAVMAVRKAQRGEATGHMVGLDAVCSGMQIMSALVGCHSGAAATGLVDPDRRADAYTECLDQMRTYLPGLPNEERAKVKQAVMTVLYGSKQEPIKVFGAGSNELNAFYKALHDMAPGACELLQDLLNSWQPYALQHSWVLPDNHHVHVKVMQTVKKRIEVDELNGSTFTYQYQDNVGSKKGLSNVANVIHSIDAYVMRSLIRRCNYDRKALNRAMRLVTEELTKRRYHLDRSLPPTGSVAAERYAATGIVDLSVIHEFTKENLVSLPTEYLNKFIQLVNEVLNYPPFPIVCVHDEFKCHANHMNQLRKHYRDIMAELADSTILDDIFSTILGQQITYTKLSGNLAQVIRQSNYALC